MTRSCPTQVHAVLTEAMFGCQLKSHTNELVPMLVAAFAQYVVDFTDRVVLPGLHASFFFGRLFFFVGGGPQYLDGRHICSL